VSADRQRSLGRTARGTGDGIGGQLADEQDSIISRRVAAEEID
jgi:hypothetical protein